ncbi:MAG: MATE family efflux transporter [Lachnospiraceae bacterium]|nr:MATE family efflux transporter [Lachnospiraceae bacterium]
MENEIFEKAPVHKAFFSLAMPVVMGMVVSLLYNMVDTYFIARTGNTNLVAGVSLGAPVFTCMIALGDILGLGGSSVISRLFGQKRDEDGKRISVFCFYASFLGGILVAVLLLAFRTPMLNLLGADQDTWTHASAYYTYIAAGAPFIILTFTPNNQLRTEGLAKSSMIGSILGTVVNIIFDPVCIFGLGMGAAGAAIATVIGNICTDVYYVWVLKNKSKKLSIDPRALSITGAELCQILAIGVPASVTNFMTSLSTMLTNRSLLPYGNDRVAAMGIAMKVNMIAVLVLVGFAFGAQPLTGYNYGAKNQERLKQILAFCYKFECALAVVFAAVLSAVARPLLGLFTENQELVRMGVSMLRWQQAGMLFVGIVLVTTCTFQSAGKAMGAFWLSISRQGIIFAAVLWILSGAFGYQGILATQALSDLLTAVLAVLLFRRYIVSEWKRPDRPRIQ